MKKDLERIIEIPEGMSAEVSGNKVTVKGSGVELSREFNVGRVNLEVKENKLRIFAKNATKRESKMIGTINAHVKNMIKGIGEEFVYNLEICNVHFPMNVKVEGDKVVINSFLGEKVPRYSKIVGSSKVDIKGTLIEVKSNDIEAAGQTAANLEKATRLTGRDRRIFQDGIFITKKVGREI